MPNKESQPPTASPAAATGPPDTATSAELQQQIRSRVAELRETVQALPHAAVEAKAACDAIESALSQLEQQDARLLKVLDEEVARRVHAEEFRRFAYEDSPFAMAIAALEDGRFIDANDAFLRRTGYARHEVIGRTSNELNLWLEGEGRERFVETLRQGDEIEGLEIRVRIKNGEIIHIRFFACVISLGGKPCILSITQNIEERHQAEQEAIRLRDFYEDLLALLPAQIAIVDTEGRYEYVSPSNLPDAGVRIAFAGRTIADLCEYLGLEPTVAEQRQAWVNLVAARNEVMQFDERFVLESGEIEHWIRTHRPVANERGEVTRVLIYSLDVTDLRRLEEQFRHSQKMEAVGRLAGGVAHDFNNLLTAIMGTADLLADHCHDPAAVQQSAREILHAAERGASLTRQLLAVSRRQVSHKTRLNINVVVDEMQDMVRRLIGENIALNVELAPSLPDVCADISQLEQVLLNLVINARDAMPEGGSLTIRTGTTDGQFVESDSLEPTSKQPLVLLTVSDSGTGMSPEVCARVFEPFFTTKEEGKGTGLGLSTVYAIVQGFQGDVLVESNEGQGSSFAIRLPVAQYGECEPAGPAASRDRPSRTGTVLVVEDETAVRDIVERILARQGYSVITAEDGHEALRVVEEKGPEIDVILTDMIMPGLSGREFAERVLESHPRMRILFMSGHIESRDSRFVAEQLGNRFIQKPFTPDVLLGRVSSILSKP